MKRVRLFDKTPRGCSHNDFFSLEPLQRVLDSSRDTIYQKLRCVDELYTVYDYMKITIRFFAPLIVCGSSLVRLT